MKSISDTRIVARLSKDGDRVLCGWRGTDGQFACGGELLIAVELPRDLVKLPSGQPRVKRGTEILYDHPQRFWAFRPGWTVDADGVYRLTAHAQALGKRGGHRRTEDQRTPVGAHLPNRCTLPHFPPSPRVRGATDTTR